MIIFLATGFYTGYLPVAPGTFGSLVAVFLSFLFPESPYGYLVMICLLSVLGVGICQRAEKELGVKDAPEIVWDEMVGLWISMLFLPRSYKWLAAAFVLFRFFDIWKPFRVVERLPGGYGIMVDDIVAGGLTNLVLQAIRRFQAF